MIIFIYLLYDVVLHYVSFQTIGFVFLEKISTKALMQCNSMVYLMMFLIVASEPYYCICDEVLNPF